MRKIILVGLMLLCSTLSWGDGFQAAFQGSRTDRLTRQSTILEYDGSIDSSGNLLDVSGSNWQQYSDQIDQWDIVGSPTVTANHTIAPDGTMTADRLQNVTNPDFVYLYPSADIGNAGDPFVPSVWIKRISTSGTLVVKSYTGIAYGSFTVALSGLPDRWVRVYPGSPYAIPGNDFVAATSGNVGLVLQTSGSTIDFYAWGAQIRKLPPGQTSSTASPGVYHPTTSVIKPDHHLAPTGSPGRAVSSLQGMDGNQLVEEF